MNDFKHMIFLTKLCKLSLTSIIMPSSYLILQTYMVTLIWTSWGRVFTGNIYQKQTKYISAYFLLLLMCFKLLPFLLFAHLKSNHTTMFCQVQLRPIVNKAHNILHAKKLIQSLCLWLCKDMKDLISCSSSWAVSSLHLLQSSTLVLLEATPGGITNSSREH